jgi:hypothetical protein
VLVANHVGADRDGNGVSAPQTLNDLLLNNALQPDPFGFAFDEVDLSLSYAPDSVLDPLHPVTNGPAGPVRRIGFYDGCTAHLTGSNPEAIGLVAQSTTTAPGSQLLVGAAQAGAGRVVFITDSAIAGDGSSSHGGYQAFKDSWNDTSTDNAALFVNAMYWVGQVE